MLTSLRELPPTPLPALLPASLPALFPVPLLRALSAPQHPCLNSSLHPSKTFSCLVLKTAVLEFATMSQIGVNAHAGSRTRVTSMGGLYDAATLRALCFHGNVCHITHFCYDLPARALVGGSRATSRGYIQCICLGWTSRCTASIRGGKEKMLCQDAMLICYANMIC